MISHGQNYFRWSSLLYINTMIVWINSREFQENGNFHLIVGLFPTTFTYNVVVGNIPSSNWATLNGNPTPSQLNMNTSSDTIKYHPTHILTHTQHNHQCNHNNIITSNTASHNYTHHKCIHHKHVISHIYNVTDTQ